jgi:hypothetical protein
LSEFNGLGKPERLAWQMPLCKAGTAVCDFKFEPLVIGVLMFDGKMFDSKNNRLLDSISFRLALIVAVFAVWSGAGYLLLSV